MVPHLSFSFSFTFFSNLTFFLFCCSVVALGGVWCWSSMNLHTAFPFTVHHVLVLSVQSQEESNLIGSTQPAGSTGFLQFGCPVSWGQGSRPKLLDQLFRIGLWGATFKSEFQLGGYARSIPLDMLISVTHFSGLVINNSDSSHSVMSDSLQSQGL